MIIIIICHLSPFLTWSCETLFSQVKWQIGWDLKELISLYVGIYYLMHYTLKRPIFPIFVLILFSLFHFCKENVVTCKEQKVVIIYWLERANLDLLLTLLYRTDRGSDSEAENFEHAEKLRQVKAVLEEVNTVFLLYTFSMAYCHL